MQGGKNKGLIIMLDSISTPNLLRLLLYSTVCERLPPLSLFSLLSCREFPVWSLRLTGDITSAGALFFLRVWNVVHSPCGHKTWGYSSVKICYFSIISMPHIHYRLWILWNFLNNDTWLYLPSRRLITAKSTSKSQSWSAIATSSCGLCVKSTT